MLRGEADMVVHSWKDLPTEFKSDTVIAATLPRADQRDLLLLKKDHFEKIKDHRSLTVFSSSPRREYNLTDFFKSHLPFSLQSVKFASVRGNIPTRVRKLLEDPETDGLIVAKAAFDRLLSAPQSEFKEVQDLLQSYLQKLTWAVLPLSVNPNAAAQGALAVEIMKNRDDLKNLLSAIHDESTYQCAQKERDILASFGGGCHQKIGIAVLSRPYGEITFLKGLTDQEKLLDERKLVPSSSVLRFSENQLWSHEVKAQRTALRPISLPSHINALYVARSEAWPEELKFSDFVWTAGLKTWKNLAQKGIWVHGCSESLGEQEDPRLDILAGVPMQWAKLSHDEGFTAANDSRALIATYTLQSTEKPGPFEGKEFFFWSSGGQFLQALQEDSGIIEKYHACGLWQYLSGDSQLLRK